MRPNASDSALSTQVERLIGTQMTRRVWEALSMPNTASAGASQRRVLTVPRRRNALVRDDCPQELFSANTRRNEHQKPGTTWVCTKSVSTKGVHAIDASTPAFGCGHTTRSPHGVRRRDKNLSVRVGIWYRYGDSSAFLIGFGAVLRAKRRDVKAGIDDFLRTALARDAAARLSRKRVSLRFHTAQCALPPTQDHPPTPKSCPLLPRSRDCGKKPSIESVL
jgi:hypothetical protein